MAFEKDYEEIKERFENYYNSFISGLTDIPEPLHSSMVYSFSSEGMRLRPILFLSAADIFGAQETDSM